MRKQDYNKIYDKSFKFPNAKISTYEELKSFLYDMRKEKPKLKRHYAKEKEISDLYALCIGFIACSFYFSQEQISNESFKRDIMVYSVLLTNISNDILSITNLVENGFEFQANIILRNLFELVYTFLVVLINKEKRIKYFDSARLQNEYTTWNQNFRMSKLNDELSKYEKTLFNEAFAEELKLKRTKAYQEYSSYSHNDYIRCYLGCYSSDSIHCSDENPILHYNLWGSYNYEANKIFNSLNYLMWMSCMYFRDIITKPEYFQKTNYISNTNYVWWNNGFMILLMLEEEMKRKQ